MTSRINGMDFIEPGSKVTIYDADGEWTQGIFLIHLEEFGVDWVLVDVNGSVHRKNSSYILEIFVSPPAQILEIDAHPKFYLAK